MTKFSVVIADDHALSASGLQLALEQHGAFEVVARATNGSEAIRLITLLKPALAILDYAMPGANGLEVHHHIKPRLPKTRVAVLTGNASPAVHRALSDAGVDGIFAKSSPIDGLLDDLHALARGETSPLNTDNSAALPRLSAREFAVLCKTAEGLSVRATAEALSISPKTVETHKTSLLRKMGVKTTAELIVAAIKAELVSLS